MSEFLDRATEAHNMWRVKLKRAIEGGEIPDESKVVVDNLCELGIWIYGEGTKLKNIPEYEILKMKHNIFHQGTAKIIQLIKEGKKEKALNDMENGEYAKISFEIILAIKKLKEKIE